MSIFVKIKNKQKEIQMSYMWRVEILFKGRVAFVTTIQKNHWCQK